MSIEVDCYESQNVLCKHHRSTVAFYVNFDLRLETGVLITDASADTNDDSLVIDAVDIVDEEVTIATSCQSTTLLIDRAVKVTLSGGTPSDEEVIITVRIASDDGQEDFVDCRLLIGGAPDPGS